MIAVYIAEDGKRFEDRFECEEYERKLQYREADGIIYGFDGDGKEVKFYEDRFCDAVIYLHAKTDKAAEIIKNRFRDEGISGARDIDHTGYWMWDDEEGYFVDMAEVIDKHQQEIDQLKRIMDTFDEK